MHRIVPSAKEEAEFRNFGVSMKKLAAKTGEEALERQFLALLEADTEDVPDHLERLVQRAAQEKIVINWKKFAWDIPVIMSANEEVKTTRLRQWAMDYWKKDSSDTEEKEEEKN